MSISLVSITTLWPFFRRFLCGPCEISVSSLSSILTDFCFFNTERTNLPSLTWLIECIHLNCYCESVVVVIISICNCYTSIYLASLHHHHPLSCLDTLHLWSGPLIYSVIIWNFRNNLVEENNIIIIIIFIVQCTSLYTLLFT